MNGNNMELDPFVFCLEFSTEFKNSSVDWGSNRCVWSHHREDIDLFMTQHNFNPDAVKITAFLREDMEHHMDLMQSEYRLQKFKLMSSIDHKVYTIMTSTEFITDAVQDVCEELCDSLLLGPCALRCEIEVFRKIVDIINELPYAYVYDADIAEVPSESDWEGYRYNGEEMIANLDLSYTYDPMYDLVNTSAVQSITIEAYIRCFTGNVIKSRRGA